jgi:uncharacterized protein YdaU (DUF1376 family)
MDATINERIALGSNSGQFGQQLCEDTETPIADETKKLFHYVQWNLADYIAGTQAMTPEQEGIYMRFLVRLYDRGKPFPDDDRFMSAMMNLDIRRWKRIKNELVEFGKILVKSSGLTNHRFEKERLKRAHELQKQANATRKYWEAKREKERTSGQSRAEVGPKSGQSRAEVGASEAEKANEINETGQPPNPYTRKSRVQNLKESKKDSDPSGSGAEAPPDEESLRELVWTKCISWLLPRSCLDEVRLRTRVGRWVQEFGAGAVIDAVAIAQKEGPVSIMAYVEGILRRKANPRPQDRDKMSMHDFIAELDRLEGIS